MYNPFRTQPLMDLPDDNQDDIEGDFEANVEKQPRKIVKNVVDLQRIRIEKLMKNPEKPVIIPETPKEKEFVYSVPSFVRNVMGSSAGAGSGEFHVYRNLRRKEYARQKIIEVKSYKQSLDEEYRTKIERNRLEAEQKTEKKRAKRLKKKKNQKQNKRTKKSSELNDVENFDDSNNESEQDSDIQPELIVSKDAFSAEKENKISKQNENSQPNAELKEKNSEEVLSESLDIKNNEFSSTEKENKISKQIENSQSNAELKEKNSEEVLSESLDIKNDEVCCKEKENNISKQIENSQFCAKLKKKNSGEVFSESLDIKNNNSQKNSN